MAVIAAFRRLFTAIEGPVPIEQALRQIGAAEQQWRVAKERVDRIVQELRDGTRR